MIVYVTSGLPDGTEPDRDFTFMIEDRISPPTLRIPGSQRGPDVCIPDSRAQEAWLHSRGDLVVAVWDCEWRFVSDEAADAFIALIGAIPSR